MTLLEKLQPKLAAFLHHRGLRIVDERSDDAFGNAIVVVEGDGFLLRVARDRGDTTIEFRRHGEERWRSLENLLEFIVGSAVTDLAYALEANFDRVANLINSDLNQRGYTAFEQTKANANIQRLFPVR